MFLLSFAPTWFTLGLLHPLQTPAHLLLVLAVGLLIAQHKLMLVNLLVFSLAVLAGLILNQFVHLQWNFELILLSIALGISLFVIMQFSLHRLMLLSFMLISGIGLGLNSTPILIPGLGSTSINNWLAGAAVSFITIPSVIALIAVPLHRYWHGIVLRVLGSWIATSVIFVLTFMLFKPNMA